MSTSGFIARIAAEGADLHQQIADLTNKNGGVEPKRQTMKMRKRINEIKIALEKVNKDG